MDYHISYWSDARIVTTDVVQASSLGEAARAAVENGCMPYCDGLTVKLMQRFECEPLSVRGGAS